MLGSIPLFVWMLAIVFIVAWMIIGCIRYNENYLMELHRLTLFGQIVYILLHGPLVWAIWITIVFIRLVKYITKYVKKGLMFVFGDVWDMISGYLRVIFYKRNWEEFKAARKERI